MRRLPYQLTKGEKISKTGKILCSETLERNRKGHAKDKSERDEEG